MEQLSVMHQDIYEVLKESTVCNLCQCEQTDCVLSCFFLFKAEIKQNVGFVYEPEDCMLPWLGTIREICTSDLISTESVYRTRSATAHVQKSLLIASNNVSGEALI